VGFAVVLGYSPVVGFERLHRKNQVERFSAILVTTRFDLPPALLPLRAAVFAVERHQERDLCAEECDES
jgi:hypothetical protein